MKKFIITIITLIIITTGVGAFFYFGFNKSFEKFESNGASYPRIANYYLDWDISDEKIDQLARWDVLVLSPNSADFHPEVFKKIKAKNPQIKILVYHLIQETDPRFAQEPEGTIARKIYDAIEENDWWLMNTDGQHFTYWPTTWMADVTNKDYQNFVVDFVTQEYFQKYPEIDGIFFDNVWFNISWVTSNQVDLNRDGISDHNLQTDSQWRIGTKNILQKTRAKNYGKIIFSNVNYHFYNKFINGKMFENFGRNQNYTWPELMSEYWTNEYGFKPNLVIINENPNNIEDPTNYQQMRFGLTSTMLGPAYYSYDIGDCCHDSIWWYDEYEVDLGQAISLPELRIFSLGPINIWLPRNPTNGIWRRKFEKGLVLVNTTDKTKTINLGKEYQKIKGSQDPKHNDGSTVKQVTLQPQDGIILLSK